MCRGCKRRIQYEWIAASPVWDRILGRHSESEYRRRERFWQAWQALGELRDERRTAFNTLSDETSAFAAIYQQTG